MNTQRMQILAVSVAMAVIGVGCNAASPRGSETIAAPTGAQPQGNASKSNGGQAEPAQILLAPDPAVKDGNPDEPSTAPVAVRGPRQDAAVSTDPQASAGPWNAIGGSVPVPVGGARAD